jgi:general stress protein YciG
MAKNNKSSLRGFAAMAPEKRREIASKGGRVSGGNFKNNRQKASEAGRKGGSR